MTNAARRKARLMSLHERNLPQVRDPGSLADAFLLLAIVRVRSSDWWHWLWSLGPSEHRNKESAWVSENILHLDPLSLFRPL